MSEFKVSDFLTLKFRYPSTEIYVADNYFMQCKRLILNIPKSELKRYNHIDSIDEAAEVYDHYVYEHEILKDDGLPEVENDENFTLIEPEEEFWGHCSNLQVWCEHNYDTRLLKANLAFPLLQKLAKAGDKLAQIKFKEEILKRLLSGSDTAVEYLFVEGYQDDLSNEELLFGLLEPSEAETLLQIQRELNLIFKFVPSIDRGVGLRHPEDPSMTYEEKQSIRGFSIEDKCVKGLELNYGDVGKEVPKCLYKLKNLRELRFSGGISGKVGEPERVIKMFSNLKSIKKFLLNLGLAITLSEHRLKTMNDLGIEIYSNEANTKITPNFIKDFLTE
jgi:hypothetical protein